MRVGWIKLHKRLIDWGWYKDVNTKTVFLHLLLTANYEPKEFLGKRIERGQAVFGYRDLARDLGISVQCARTAISHLKSTGEITLEATQRFTVATIVKWPLYQCADGDDNTACNTAPNTQTTHDQHTANTQLTPSKKKEGKKEEKKQILPGGFDAFYAAYPRKVSPHDARKAWDKLTPDATLVEDIMSGLERFVAEHKASLASGKFTPEYPYPATWLNKRRWQDGAQRECQAQQKVDLSSLEVK